MEEVIGFIIGIGLFVMLHERIIKACERLINNRK
jgi:hypothetical protein